MTFFGWSVNYWSVFCTFFGNKYIQNLKFSDVGFFLFFFAPLNEMVPLAKKSSYFKKKSLTVTSLFGE